MSTNTPLQQLVKPGYADSADVAVLNANFDLLDKIGTVLCTSATRPAASLFNGLNIYETDTKKKFTYDGSNWICTDYLGAWDTYTPVWTAVTTNPALGNGTISGRYKHVGHDLDLVIKLIMGSTTTFGTGNWLFSLPTLTAQDGTVLLPTTSAAMAIQGATRFSGLVLMNDTTHLLVFDSTTKAGVTSVNPFAWAAASTNTLSFTARFEVTT